MKKFFVLLFVSVMCIISLSSALTAFAEEDYQTNIVFRVEETNPTVSQLQTDIQPETATSDYTKTANQDKTSTADSVNDLQFIKTGAASLLYIAVLLILSVLALAALCMNSAKNKRSK